MKLLIITLCVACAYADVSHVVKDEAHAQIERQGLDISPEGNYEWSFDTQNGISGGAKGVIKNPNDEYPAQEAQGQAAWTSPEGVPVSFQYIADENGYQPQGSHIPTSPPIPEAIIRALEYIRAHPPKPEN